jgi:Leucine rich repeat
MADSREKRPRPPLAEWWSLNPRLGSLVVALLSWLATTGIAASIQFYYDHYSILPVNESDSCASTKLNFGTNNATSQFNPIHMIGLPFVEAAGSKKKRRSTSSSPKISQAHLEICLATDGYRGHVSSLPNTKVNRQRLSWLLQVAGYSDLTLLSSSTPQHRAACWMLYQNKRLPSRKILFIQRYVMAILHFATQDPKQEASTATKITSSTWDWPMIRSFDPNIGTGNWMHPTKHECEWFGVVCQHHWKVAMHGLFIPSWIFAAISGNTRVITGLELSFLKLNGLLPRELSELPYLQELDVHGNDLQGVLPHKIVASLHQLQYLRLQMNGFFGAIPREIVNGLSHSLTELTLFGNYFNSKIPTQLGGLTKLTHLDLYANNFEGTIPYELGQLKQLEYLDLHDNDLRGSVPADVCKLRTAGKLKDLIADCLVTKQTPQPEVSCNCCTVCCAGLPVMKCVDVATGTEIKYPIKKTID